MSAFEGVEFNFANARLDGWSGGVEIFLAYKSPNGIAVVNAFQMKQYREDEAPSPTSIKLSKETARGLLDALWATGLRPSGELDSVGQLSALKAHLEDMRQLTFKTLTVEKP